jgi:iron complex transport system substrate-binding protein
MIADVLYAFPGVPDRIVGIGRISQGEGSFPEALDRRFDEKVVFERNVGPEQVASVQPDLVILKTFMRETLGRPLEQLGIPVLYVELETPEQYERDITLLGAALNAPERARELVDFFRTRREEIEGVTREMDPQEKPETLLIYYRSAGGDVSFQVPPRDWIQSRLVISAGGTPVWTDSVTGSGWQTVGFEQIALWNPETIILVSYNENPGDIRDRLADEPRWQALKAIQNGSFLAFPGDYYSWDQPDTRWILGLQWLAGRLHPDSFPDMKGTAPAAAFFDTLYGMDDGAFRSTIVPLLTGDID